MHLGNFLWDETGVSDAWTQGVVIFQVGMPCPLLSQHGTYKTVKGRFWPWL